MIKCYVNTTRNKEHTKEASAHQNKNDRILLNELFFSDYSQNISGMKISLAMKSNASKIYFIMDWNSILVDIISGFMLTPS